MDPYQFARWHDFFLAAAGAAAALTGLLFVGLSLHIRYIASNSVYRNMARGSLIGLVTVLVISLIALVSQSDRSAGIELALVGALYVFGEGAYELVTYGRRSDRRVARMTVVRSGIGHLLALVAIAGSLGVVFKVGPGLYAVAFISITIMVWNLWNAWELLIGVADEEVVLDSR
jgi:modulator of FtsH protease